jgi:ATP-dependent Clp protease ATP-binding subunit ClpB
VVQVAQRYSHQVVETSHLLSALLEQPKGLARRILQTAGADPSSVLSDIEAHLASQPKVSGHSDQVCMAADFGLAQAVLHCGNSSWCTC